jgi:hypothetical protein
MEQPKIILTADLEASFLLFAPASGSYDFINLELLVFEVDDFSILLASFSFRTRDSV